MPDEVDLLHSSLQQQAKAIEYIYPSGRHRCWPPLLRDSSVQRASFPIMTFEGFCVELVMARRTIVDRPAVRILKAMRHPHGSFGGSARPVEGGPTASPLTL